MPNLGRAPGGRQPAAPWKLHGRPPHHLRRCRHRCRHPHRRANCRRPARRQRWSGRSHSFQRESLHGRRLQLDGRGSGGAWKPDPAGRQQPGHQSPPPSPDCRRRRARRGRAARLQRRERALHRRRSRARRGRSARRHDDRRDPGTDSAHGQRRTRIAPGSSAEAGTTRHSRPVRRGSCSMRSSPIGLRASSRGTDARRG